jgi:TonB-dependent receptor
MFKRPVLSTAIAVALAIAAQSTIAQEANDPDDTEVLEEVVVTGIRGSLSRAIDLKRSNTQIVDSIVTEDIGKFPDNNVVESLQRVSGVQTTARGGSEVNNVTIRGLPDITTTVNGRRIFTSSGRDVALADIPASLLHRVDVYKTRASEQIASGIAGQIDIVTHRPFNFSDRKFVVAARGIYQSLSEDVDPHLSMLASDRWSTSAGEFGALLNVSYAETNYRDESVTVGALFPFFTGTLEPQVPTPPADPGFVPYGRIPDQFNEQTVWVPGLEAGLPFAAGSTLPFDGSPVEYLLARDAVFASDLTGSRKRPAANISLQFSPNDSSEYVFEAFYNGYRNDFFNSLFFTFIDNPDQTGLPTDNVQVFPGTNVIRQRQLNAPFIFTSGDLTVQQTDSYVYALGGNWDIGENFALESEIVYQTSEFTSDFFAMRAIRIPYRMSIDTNPGGGIPAYEFFDDPNTADVDERDLTNAGQWPLDFMYDNADKDEGDAITFTLDGDYHMDSGWIERVSFGVYYDDRSATEAARTAEMAPCDAAAAGCSFADNPGMAFVNDDFFDGRANMPTSWVTVDGHYIYSRADEFRSLYGLPTSDELAVATNFDIEERSIAAYLQADFSTEIAGRALTGQAGLRYIDVDTDMSFTGTTTTAGSSELLPSITVKYALGEDLIARFAYTETLRRPDFGDLNPNITYVPDVTDVGRGTADGGNPNLEPTESVNYDLALEWYFAESSALYVTLFRREVEGFVFDTNTGITFEGDDYVLNRPANSSNGELEGVELGIVYFPDYLPGILDGFGVQASYTELDSIQDFPVTDENGEITGFDTTPLFFVSDSSYSVVLAYDKEDFDARLSYVWRDDFLAAYEARIFANPLGIYSKPEESLDLQFSYHVTDNFVVTFDATNLTDQVFQTYYEYPDIMNFGSSIFSRTYALGIRASF